MTYIVTFERFLARQRFRTTKVKGFAAIPSAINHHGCIAIEDADRARRFFLVSHEFSRALDEQCERRLYGIKQMRSNSNREYELRTPAEWLSTDNLVGLENRIESAAYGLHKIGQSAVAETLGGHYMAWQSKWDALRTRARSMKKKKGMLSTGDADRLLDRAEELLADIAEVIWLAADAANIDLFPWGVTRLDKGAPTKPPPRT